MKREKGKGREVLTKTLTLTLSHKGRGFLVFTLLLFTFTLSYSEWGLVQTNYLYDSPGAYPMGSISYPANGEVVSQDTYTIIGTAYDNYSVSDTSHRISEMDRYEIHYGLGENPKS